MMGELYLIQAWMSEYWGRTGFAILFMLACVYFYNKSSERNKKSIALTAVLIWLMSYSGTAVQIARAVDYYDEWYRMFWILPVIPVVACFFVSFVDDQKDIITKLGAVTLLIFVMAATSTNGTGNMGYSKASTQYGLGIEYITLATIIKEDDRAEEPHVACDRQVGIEMRLWDQSIYYSITRWTHECIDAYGIDYDFESNGIEDLESKITLAKVVLRGREEDVKDFHEAIQTEEVDYIVLKKGRVSAEYIQEIDVEYCGESTNYYVYYCGMHK